MILFTRIIREGDPGELKAQWDIFQRIYDTFIKLRRVIEKWLMEPVVPPPPVIIDPLPEPNKPKVSKLEEFAEAIKTFEGWYPGSRSYRNLNPGNLKYTSLVQSLGAIGQDEGGFAKFIAYGDGFNALCDFIKFASEDRLLLYKNCTIKSFFAVYSPDGNSLPYANFVAKKCEVPVETSLKTII